MKLFASKSNNVLQMLLFEPLGHDIIIVIVTLVKCPIQELVILLAAHVGPDVSGLSDHNICIQVELQSFFFLSFIPRQVIRLIFSLSYLTAQV